MSRTYVEKIARDLGIPIKDAARAAHVRVTQNDVVKASRLNSRSCAFSRASVRLPGVTKAYFFRGTAYLQYQDRMERYVLPPSVQKEIISFDRAKIVAAGSYQLTPPPISRSKPVSAEYRKNRKQKIAQAKSTEKISSIKSAAGKLTAGAFTTKVSSIIEPTKKPQHRTQYVRDARDPG